jgi:divalent metal cation (Fe/Co/Zn/Cd) transporter
MSHDDHGHTHGIVDPTIATSERGIWAIKWSFVVLIATAVMQFVVVVLSGSVALLSDTIHNFGDAATAMPLWIAFALTRLGASRRFTFGYGRVEDLAGVVIVLIILFSAVVAGYQAIERILNPHPWGSCGRSRRLRWSASSATRRWPSSASGWAGR